MNDDWTVDGDLGLGGASPEDEKKKKWNKWLERTRSESDPIRPRRATIRTLSGSWVQKQGESNALASLRRRSLGTQQELPLFIPSEHQRSSTGSKKYSVNKRNGSVASCPEVLKKLRRRIGIHLAKGHKMGQEHNTQETTDAEELLKEANLTISALQSKLDIYEDLLYGKSRASEVLLTQLLESTKDRVNSEAQWRSEVREHRLEASRLQFQLMSFEGNLTDTQRAWLDRINSVVKENVELQSTLQSQNRLIRRLSSEKTIWKKECEELYSKDDARERRAYQRSSSIGTSAEQAIVELAILGSCTCRSKKQEPCACAKSACRRHQEVVKLQKKVTELESQKDEMSRIVEIYKEAFEEQLQRTRTLTKKMVQLDRENELAVRNGKLPGLLRLRIQRDNQSAVINTLVDTVCDRTDALLQQQILTKLLSRKLTEMENDTNLP